MTDFAAIRSSSAVQSAYNKTRSLQSDKTNQADQGNTTQGPDFSQMVSKAASNAAETVRQGDQTAMAGLTGQAGIQQVVEATMAMESTVRVSVAVRDKFVEAYQEIMRMPI
ncbi:flagellar hook-basal body complex protein FliE [Pelagimonas sp. KU-00592-HH]|jgi:flagellar hook-basal body complex protein FliE|uniref:flagellar hook-basal body complex protein FliE n=1 Tax=Roseobacteraceae TaxID=2854170 RepID=UPI0020CEE5C8|nr:flagellar hook-basal body complex protein FliE [Shimia sp. CNT1-13L.2]MCP9481070.1 flagellar hook-basal body complex protein FliE [Shimia sp. CNT1-13L.2]